MLPKHHLASMLGKFTSITPCSLCSVALQILFRYPVPLLDLIPEHDHRKGRASYQGYVD